ncbi:MAG TPA: DUF1801 domain-containing protein [Thermoanaerobaculia bacterium]|nr:DUF1801 domain-containing protein [Thermoanaerobaculia bacterium]
MAELKTKKTGASVKQFLDSIEDPTRREDCRQVVELMREVTGERPEMWGPSIIGFGRYQYRYESGREGDWFLTGLSPRKRNLTLYVIAGFAEHDELLSRLGRHETGKSCLYVKRLADLDMEVLRRLVERSVAEMRERYPD